MEDKNISNDFETIRKTYFDEIKDTSDNINNNNILYTAGRYSSMIVKMLQDFNLTELDIFSRLYFDNKNIEVYKVSYDPTTLDVYIHYEWVDEKFGKQYDKRKLVEFNKAYDYLYREYHHEDNNHILEDIVYMVAETISRKNGENLFRVEFDINIKPVIDVLVPASVAPNEYCMRDYIMKNTKEFLEKHKDEILGMIYNSLHYEWLKREIGVSKFTIEKVNVNEDGK